MVKSFKNNTLQKSIHMKNFILAFLILCSFISFAQKMEKEMPKGYEQEKMGITKGKIDTVLYESKTVGSTRKTLVYTPPN